MKRLQWMPQTCPVTSIELELCQDYRQCAVMVPETKALELTWWITTVVG